MPYRHCIPLPRHAPNDSNHCPNVQIFSVIAMALPSCAVPGVSERALTALCVPSACHATLFHSSGRFIYYCWCCCCAAIRRGDTDTWSKTASVPLQHAESRGDVKLTNCPRHGGLEWEGRGRRGQDTTHQTPGEYTTAYSSQGRMRGSLWEGREGKKRRERGAKRAGAQQASHLDRNLFPIRIDWKFVGGQGRLHRRGTTPSNPPANKPAPNPHWLPLCWRPGASTPARHYPQPAILDPIHIDCYFAAGQGHLHRRGTTPSQPFDPKPHRLPLRCRPGAPTPARPYPQPVNLVLIWSQSTLTATSLAAGRGRLHRRGTTPSQPSWSQSILTTTLPPARGAYIGEALPPASHLIPIRIDCRFAALQGRLHQEGAAPSQPSDPNPYWQPLADGYGHLRRQGTTPSQPMDSNAHWLLWWLTARCGWSTFHREACSAWPMHTVCVPEPPLAECTTAWGEIYIYIYIYVHTCSVILIMCILISYRQLIL